MRFITLTLAAMLLCFNLQAALPDIKDFAKDNQWTNVKISPTGDYISAVTRVEGRKTIVIIDVKTFTVLYTLKFDRKTQPGEYFWASDQRIVAEVEYLVHWQSHPISYGEYYAVNMDGSKAKYVFGTELGTNIRNRGLAGTFLDSLPLDDRHILITGQKLSKSGELLPKVFKVDIMNGRNKQIARSPVIGGRFLTDQHQKVRFVTGADEQNFRRSFLLQDEKWVSTADLNIDNNTFNPISINGDNDQVYALYAEDSGPKGLYLFDLKTGKKEKIFQHKTVSLSDIKTDKSGYAYAVEFDDGYPTTRIIDPNHIDAKLLKKLMTTLKGYRVSVLNETLDGNLKVVLASNQFNAGLYYLYNVKKDTLWQMFAKRPWVDSQTAANMVPFNYKARDGVALSGYVTLPLGADTLKQAKNLPFVVQVHGGPHGVRDYMGYDSENQLYASRGIAVLQVNFRGSGGFGSHFKVLGEQHWGDHIQFDIIDGIKALINQGVADKNKLCIVGTSFGGYSALQSAVLAPDLFKCAVGIAGLYDLALMYDTGSIKSGKTGNAYLKDAIGTDTKLLKAFSPVYHLDKLKSAVLIIHGGEDERVPIEHAEVLKKGLKKRGIPFEWMVLEEEGHGFYKPEHKEQVYQRTLDFLLKYLKVKTQ